MKSTSFTSIGFRYLHFRGGYIKGNLRGGNWVQILQEVEFIREGRGRRRGVGEKGQRARGIAIGGHSSIRGINTLELMKAPREQQASGRNVNRDRPASDPFSCTANSQGPHLSPSRTPFTLHPSPCYTVRRTFELASNSVSSATHTVIPTATIPYMYIHMYIFIYSFTIKWISRRKSQMFYKEYLKNIWFQKISFFLLII